MVSNTKHHRNDEVIYYDHLIFGVAQCSMRLRLVVVSCMRHEVFRLQYKNFCFYGVFSLAFRCLCP